MHQRGGLRWDCTRLRRMVTALERTSSGTGTVRALYVDPVAQGAGLGTLLLDGAVERLVEAGHDEATLWVFAANGLGRAFYEARGWELDPAGAGQEGEGWLAPAVRYRRDL